MPGFGESGKPPNNWGIYEYGEFAVKVLEKLGIKKAVIMGHSFGGRIGILLAASTDKAIKLILVDAAGMEDKSMKVKILRLFSPAARLFPEKIKAKFRSTDRREAGELREVFIRVIGQPLEAELVKIRVPTLIIWGENDRVQTLKEAKILNSGIKNSVLRIVWGAGHWPHLEKTGQLIRILKEENV
jgi:pimeloyl-ACP methyl ester carboxylesterase